MLPASDSAGPTIDVEVTVEVAGRQRFAVACDHHRLDCGVGLRLRNARHDRTACL
jgi:hypothetical protein